MNGISLPTQDLEERAKIKRENLVKKHQEFLKNLSLEDYVKLSLLKKYGAKINRDLPKDLGSLARIISLNYVLGLKKPAPPNLLFAQAIHKKSPEEFSRITGEPYPAKITERMSVIAKTYKNLPEEQKKVKKIQI